MFVYGDDGDVAIFSVDSKEQVLKPTFPLKRIWNGSQQPLIRLITCGGEFDRSTGHYLSNLHRLRPPGEVESGGYVEHGKGAIVRMGAAMGRSSGKSYLWVYSPRLLFFSPGPLSAPRWSSRTTTSSYGRSYCWPSGWSFS